MSMPPLTWMPPWMSETARIFAPASKHMRAAIEPTLPKPCTTIRLPLSVSPRRGAASRAISMSPRPVASTRPREPPSDRGLPVTTAVTVWRACME